MPTKNRVKTFAPGAYYHVYNRGINKRQVFLDNKDYAVFLNLLKRYLSSEVAKDRYGRPYANLSDKVELLAFCLMPSHFHLLLYQKELTGMTELLQRVLTAYSVYFNKRYRRIGKLFQDVYKASRITSDEYLQHISRYIHLNPKHWRQWDFSSLIYYQGGKVATWLKIKVVLGLFNDRKEYLEFISDYEDYKKTLDDIKHQLADS